MQVRRLAQPLEDLRELAASDNVDTFVMSYNSLLQAIPPLLVTRGWDTIGSAFSQPFKLMPSRCEPPVVEIFIEHTRTILPLGKSPGTHWYWVFLQKSSTVNNALGSTPHLTFCMGVQRGSSLRV